MLYRIFVVLASATVSVSFADAQSPPPCPDPQVWQHMAQEAKERNIYSQRCDPILLSIRQKIEEHSRQLDLEQKKEFNACLSSIALVGAGVSDPKSPRSQMIYHDFAQLNCVARFSSCLSALGRVLQASCLEKVLRIAGTLEPQSTPTPTPTPAHLRRIG